MTVKTEKGASLLQIMVYRGMPIEQVSKMLGHESIETTQIYLDLDENSLEQAHKKYVV